MEITKAKMFFVFLIAFLTGVFFGSVWNLANFISGIFLIAGMVFLVWNYRNSKNIMLFFICLGLFLGMWRVNSELKKIYPRPEINFQGEVLTISEPIKKENYQQLKVCPKKENKFDCKEKYIINTALYPAYEYGQIIKVSCRLENPKNEYEKFDYIRFLAKDNIYQICRSAKMEKIDGNSFEKNIPIKIIIVKKTILFKKNLEEKINALFSQPESGYLAGLLLGGDDRLSKETAENFRRTGTTHTIAVSGYNITILAQFLMILGISLGLWRQKAFYLAIIGIIFFVLMIGSPASALRAAIMGGLILWANKKGRLANSYRAVVLAGTIMVFFSPLALLYDVGLQLSFLATLAIVLVYSQLAEKMNIKNDFLGLKSILWVTISAQLGVLGILIYNFESFSLISLLANLVILPLVPIIMFCGFFVAISSFLFFPLAKIIALPVWLGLHLEIKIIEYLAGLPWAIIDIKNITWHWLVGYYLFFTLFVIWLRKKK